MQFKCKKNPVNSRNHNLVLFNPLIGLCQVLPLLARVDLGAMAMKGYSAFPKSPARTLVAEVQLVYSTVEADWAK